MKILFSETMANRSPQPLTREAQSKGAAGSTAARVERHDAWARSIYAGVRTLARKVSVRDLTNDQIAEHLKQAPFNITAPRGGELTGKLVHKAFARMGVNRSDIKALRAKALKAADAYGIDDHQLMIFQLWHEWQHHEAVSYFELGQRVGGEARPFRFVPVHPSVWVAPWVREPRSILSMMGPPPTAHLVQALMGMLDPFNADAIEQAERAKGEAGHGDDPTNYGDYLRSVGAIPDA